ncbi:hypothetical protein AVEN_34-1, partial [Araneus ventricosus]
CLTPLSESVPASVFSERLTLQFSDSLTLFQKGSDISRVSWHCQSGRMFWEQSWYCQSVLPLLESQALLSEKSPTTFESPAR